MIRPFAFFAFLSLPDAGPNARGDRQGHAAFGRVVEGMDVAETEGERP